jgi:hypothetical protein
LTDVLTATAIDIIDGALRLIQQVDSNQTTPAVEAQDALQALNQMLKSYQNQGLHLWTKTEGILFLDVGKQSYSLGPSGDEACNVDDFINTELSTAGAALDTTLALDDTTGMAVGDNIGILLDDGTRQWTTIATIPGGTSVTINVALTGAAAIDNSVFTFTTFLPRPLRILQLRRDNIGDTNNELESNQWSRDEYFAQPNKSSQGDLVNWYYSPQLTDGRIYVWQTANDADKVARFTYERPFDVYVNTTDVVTLPSEWFRTIKYNLAVDIAPEYSVEPAVLDRITGKAALLLEDSLGFDQENDALQMQPDFT